MSARILASYIGKLATTAAANATTIDLAGQYTNPHWSVFGLLSHEGKRLATTLDLRWFEGGKIDVTKTEGGASLNSVNINHARATLYTNLTLTYDFSAEANHGLEAFVRFNNIFDRAPPFPNTGEGATIFDVVGRAFRAGVRVKL